MRHAHRTLVGIAILAIPIALQGAERGEPAFSPDGSKLAVPNEDGTVAVWDVARSRRLFKVYEPFDPSWIKVAVWSTWPIATFSPDGRLLATQRQHEPIKIWRVTDAGQVTAFAGVGAVHHLEFSPDGSRLVAFGKSDKTAGPHCLCLWEVFSQKERLRLRELDGLELQAIGFSPDGAMLLTAGTERGSANRTVRIWSSATGQELVRLDADAARFAPSGNGVVAWGRDRSVRFWNATTRRQQSLDEGTDKPESRN